MDLRLGGRDAFVGAHVDRRFPRGGRPSGCFSNQNWQHPLRIEIVDAKWQKGAHEGLPSRQNARLRAGIEKETEGVALVSTRHTNAAISIAALHLISLGRSENG
jgi:hypothetical protein